LLAQAYLALPLISLGLVFIGFRRLQTKLASWSRLPAPGLRPSLEWQKSQASQTARLVAAAARHSLVPFNCLPQSLALWWLLRRQGISVDLRIGVMPKGRQLEAHAWVEFQGSVLNDHAGVLEHFTAFPAAITPPPSDNPPDGC